MATRAQHESGVVTNTVSTVKPSSATRDLNDRPLPFLDWSLVETGTTSWVGEHGEPISAADAREYPESAIVPVQIGVPSGIRIRVQQSEKTGCIFTDECAWEAGLRPGSSAFLDDEIFRIWYHSAAGLVYAQSADGVNWARPLIDFVPFETHQSTNLLPPVENTGSRRIAMHEGSIFIDPNGKAEERYKAIFTGSVTAAELEQFERDSGLLCSQAARVRKKALFGAVSPDGLSWHMVEQPVMLHPGDMQVVVEYDPLLRRYIGFFRGQEMSRRTIARAETDDFWHWPLPATVFACGPEDEPSIDLQNCCYTSYPGNADIRLMFPTIYDAGADRMHVRLAVSHDGIIWHRVPGEAILPGKAGAFDECGVLSNTGLLSSFDERFVLLYTGYNRPMTYPKTEENACRFGCAWWPEERLAAIEADERGEFTTVPLRLRGGRVLLNLQTRRTGEVRVELRDNRFQTIPGRAFSDGDSISGDHRWVPISWRGNTDLSALKGHLVYLRFRMRAAKLFAMKAES